MKGGTYENNTFPRLNRVGMADRMIKGYFTSAIAVGHDAVIAFRRNNGKNEQRKRKAGRKICCVAV